MAIDDKRYKAKNKNKNDKNRKQRPKNTETKIDDKLVHIFKIMLEKQ